MLYIVVGVGSCKLYRIVIFQMKVVEIGGKQPKKVKST